MFLVLANPVMADGRLPHALLLEIFTDRGIGSMIVASGYTNL